MNRTRRHPPSPSPYRTQAARALLALACTSAVLVPIAGTTPTAAAATDAAPEPGALARLVSGGYTENDQGEPVNGIFTTDPDGSDPALLVQRQRPFTQADQDAGRLDATLARPSVSPDGTRIAAWVTDPEGFVIPGGTPEADLTYPLDGSTGEVLALFDATGAFVRVVHEIRWDGGRKHVHSYNPITWLDDRRVVVTGSRPLFAGTPEETTQGVLKRIDVVDRTVLDIAKDNGTPRGDFLTDGWAGGGTIVARSGTGSVYVLRAGQSSWDELPEAVPGEETNEGFSHAAVTPDGRHIAVSYQGPRTDAGTRAQVDVFDLAQDGSWERRNIAVPDLSSNAHWPRWLPYADYSQAELLLPVTAPDDTDRAVGVRVAPGLASSERITRTFPGTTQPDTWLPVPVPPASSGLADAAVSIVPTSTTAGAPWTGQVRVTGRGPATAHGLSLTVRLDGTPATTASVPGGSCSAGTCTLPDLAPGESATVTVGSTFAASGIATLDASVASASGDWHRGNNRRTSAVRVTSAIRNAVAGRIVRQAANGGDIVASNPDGSQPKVLVAAAASSGVQLMEVHAETGLFLWHEGDASRYHVETVTGDPVRSFTVPDGSPWVAITPDGRTAFWTRNMPLGGPQANDDKFLIESRRIDVADAPVRLRHDFQGTVPIGLRVSPDGTRLAYVAQPVGQYAYQAVVFDLDFRRPVTLDASSRGALRVNTTPAWSPDGSRIALAVGEATPHDATGEVLAFNLADPRTPTVLAPLTEEALTVRQWSPTGERILLGDLGRTVALSLSTKQLTPLANARAWWSGDPVTVAPPPPPPPPPGDTTAPTASYRLSPATYARRGSKVTLSRVTAGDNVDTAEQLQVTVSWGDGTTSNGTAATSSFTHAYATNSRPSVKVTVTDRAGNSTSHTVSTLVVDGTAPAITVKLPACGRRNVRQCAQFRSTRAAWATIRGAVSDSGGSGLASVTAALVQKRGTRWWSYNGSVWTPRVSKTAALKAAKRIAVTRRQSAWSVKATNLRGGTLLVTAQAKDRSGNLRQAVRTQTLR